MRKETLLAATVLLAFTVPAGAACLDQVAQLEQRLAQLEEAETAGAQQQATGIGQQQQPAAADQEQQPGAGGAQGWAVPAQPQPAAGAEPQQEVAQQQPAPAGEATPEETVAVQLRDGQTVEVTAEPPGGEMEAQHTWLGGTSPPSVQGAREQLDGARGLAEEGNEAGCMEQAAQAERIISGLEGQ